MGSEERLPVPLRWAGTWQRRRMETVAASLSGAGSVGP